MKRVAILPPIPSLDAIRTGFGEAAKALKDGQDTILLVVTSLANLKDNDLQKVLTKDRASELASGKIVKIEGIKFVLATDRKLPPPHVFADVILGIHVEAETLEKACRTQNSAQVIVFVPWMESHAHEFVSAPGVKIIAPRQAGQMTSIQPSTSKLSISNPTPIISR